MYKRFLIACAMTLALASQSYATLIHGSVVFNGGSATTDTNNLLTATTVTPGGSTTVLGGTGSFAGIGGTAVTFDVGTLNIGSFSGPVAFASFGNYSFTMDSLTTATSTAASGNNSLTIFGLGSFVDNTGFYDTSAGNFNLTLQDPGFGSPVTTFSFSSSASSVPEPASLALLSLGLFGLGMARRRK